MSWWLYIIGLLIVIATHIYMFVSGLPAEQMPAHAILNIVAAILLATGWLTRKA